MIDAVIAAKVYERTIFNIAALLNEKPGPLERGQTKAGNLVEKLDRRAELRKLGIKPGELREMWRWRCQAVHDEPEINPPAAKDFVEGVARFSNSLSECPPPD